jgi:hypothetical protein
MQASAVTSTPSIGEDPVVGSKEYEDMRDRAAYVYVTGANPTHLRSRMSALLRARTSYSRKPVSLDGLSGCIKVAEENVKRLSLENHPMVVKAKSFVDEGYKIELATHWKARRPYSKILLFKQDPAGQVTRVTVQNDGSVLEGWGLA